MAGRPVSQVVDIREEWIGEGERAFREEASVPSSYSSSSYYYFILPPGSLCSTRLRDRSFSMENTCPRYRSNSNYRRSAKAFCRPHKNRVEESLCALSSSSIIVPHPWLFLLSRSHYGFSLSLGTIGHPSSSFHFLFTLTISSYNFNYPSQHFIIIIVVVVIS